MVTTDVRREIEAQNRRFMDAFRRGDAAGMADLYTASGQLLPPNSDVVTGRKNIRAFWQDVIALGLTEATLETVELQGGGETGIELGRYTLLGAGGQVVDAGKYVVIWRPEGRTWKLHRDIWNTSQPAVAK